MNTAAASQSFVRIDLAHQLSLIFHFLLLSFVTTSLLMGVIVSEDSILYGMLGLFFVGAAQLLSAFVGALQYGRLWQAVHLMAAACFIGVQIAALSLLGDLDLDFLPDSAWWVWGVGTVVISLSAGWAYWFNLRASYAREAAEAMNSPEASMV